MTTLAEPEWDQATRDLALALDAIDMCPFCGQPTVVCQDPERQDDWEASNPVRCHAHTARLARQKGVTEQTNPHAGALLWPVRLRERNT